MLSPESKERLCALLPRTAFGYASKDVGDSHPLKTHQPSASSNLEHESGMDIDTSPASLEPSFFNDPHFEAACRTFQVCWLYNVTLEGLSSSDRTISTQAGCDQAILLSCPSSETGSWTARSMCRGKMRSGMRNTLKQKTPRATMTGASRK